MRAAVDFGRHGGRGGLSASRRARRAVAGLAGALIVAGSLLLGAAPARAEDRVVVTSADLRVNHGADPGTYVDAQFELPLPAALRDAIDHGIALYFVVEVEVSRSRWWWFDKRLLNDAVQTRVSFSPLTRQYRLTRGGLAQPFDTLDQALGTLRRVSQWRVGDAALLDGGKVQARIRLRLDTSMLPKPFQVNALTDRDWTLASDWTSLAVIEDPVAGN
jgi:hypothetical protein